MGSRTRERIVLMLVVAVVWAVLPLSIGGSGGQGLGTLPRAGAVAYAGTYTVDTTVDDGALSACTTAADDCSLRGAIAAANASAGYDAILFDIPAASCPGGVCTITLIDGPISVDDETMIDATSQPQNDGSHANVCATETAPSFMRIQIITDPTSLTPDAFYISATSGVTTIRGFSIGTNSTTGFYGAIRITDGSGHKAQCNHIGVDAAGTSPLGSGQLSMGVSVEGLASGVVIGTDGDGVGDIGERNVIGNVGYGVYVNANNGNRISGNYVGIGADGTTNIGGTTGLYARQSSSDNIMGTDGDGVSDDLERNYIGNVGTGILCDPSSSGIGNVVAGNTVGITPSGTAAATTVGIALQGLKASNTGFVINGNTVGNSTTGLQVDGVGASASIFGNFVGTDATGTTAYPNATGISLQTDGQYTVHDNLIANSTVSGVTLAGTTSFGAASENNCVIGNVVGTWNGTGVSTIFELNWWGDESGPSGQGSGSGDSVSVDVDYDPWLLYPPNVCAPSVQRLWGLSRFDTAVEVSRRSFPGGASTVFVANGFGFADALAGGVAAGLTPGPVLLVRSDLVPAETAAELSRLAPSEIVILGGTAAISDTVETALAAYAPTVRRLAGADRFATAVAIAADAFPSGASTVVLADGLNYPDALAGVPAAAKLSAPLLLTRTSLLPTVTADEIVALGASRVVILGGTSAVSADVEAVVGALSGVTSVERWSGASRFATAAAISGAVWPSGAGMVYVAYGLNFPDALAGGPGAFMDDGPLLLVATDSIPTETEAEITRLAPDRIVILGGTGVVSDAVKTQLEALVGP